MIVAQIRLRLALVNVVLRSLDRSRQVVVLFAAVVVGQYTVTDPAAWIAPLRPLLLAPRPEPGGYFLSLVLALVVIGAGVALKPVFEWSGHSRYFLHVGASRGASMVADLVVVALSILPVATLLTAGVARSRFTDGAAIVTLVMSVVLLATWLRIAASSLPLATAVVGASVAAVAWIGTRASGPVILSTALVITIVAFVADRFGPRRSGERGPAWRTGWPRVDVWLRLHFDAVRSRSPWMFVPTLALGALIGSAADHDAAPARDPVLLIAALLLLWQFGAAANTTVLALDAWRRSRVLRQLPVRFVDTGTRVLVSSVVLFALASPAEAMSLHASGNDIVAGWTCLAVASPWVVLWSQSRVLLRHLLSWSAIVGVAWVALARP